jgi:general nucleoside transport system ATP-binding protein
VILVHPARSKKQIAACSVAIPNTVPERRPPGGRQFPLGQAEPPHILGGGLAEPAAPVLELRGITKRFPGIVANDRVDFDLLRGEVHALLGENGAGKSTLVNVLYGLYHPDEGEIHVKGRRIRLGSPKEAIEQGIGMVHQHFMLIPVMSVAENVVLASEPTHGRLFLDYAEAAKRVEALSKQFGLVVDPRAKVEAIGVGEQQRVEILKALYRGADILILDEPTAVLTPQEADELFSVIRSLTAQGKSVIFISHKLHEVLDIADRITVLRRGKLVETRPRAGATEAELARAMVGREVLLRVDKRPPQTGGPLLAVEDLVVHDERRLEVVRGVSFEVRAGEIVGIAGVDGNGQTELIDALTGLRHPSSGRVTVDGRDLTHATAKQALHAGVGHIPQDRQRRGLVLQFTLAENIGLHDFDHPPVSRHGWLRPRVLVERAGRLLQQFDVRGGGPLTSAGALSGGNQQKVVLAREIERNPKVLIAGQPTRGLDVGAIEFVHRRLVEERDAGRGILLVSLELDEILSLSDRIFVIYEGRLVAEFGPDADEHEVGLAMTGGRQEVSA